MPVWAWRQTKEKKMKAFALAIAMILVISVGSSVVLNANFQKSSEQAFATTGTRL
jgi:hypothetical protein